MEHSRALENLAIEKLHKLERFLTNHTPYSVDLVFEAHKTHQYSIVELRVQTGAFHLIAQDEGPDIYKLIDSVIAKMKRELAKAKDKMVTHAHGKMHGK